MQNWGAEFKKVYKSVYKSVQIEYETIKQLKVTSVAKVFFVIK